jgi:hypothetical protein
MKWLNKKVGVPMWLMLVIIMSTIRDIVRLIVELSETLK